MLRGMRSGLFHGFKQFRTNSTYGYWTLPQNRSIARMKVLWSSVRLLLKLAVGLACVVSVAFLSSTVVRPKNTNSRCVFKKIQKLGKSHLLSSDKLYLAVNLDHSLGDSLFKFAALVSIAAKVKRKLAFSKDRVNPVADVFDVTAAKKVNIECWKNIQEYVGINKHVIFKSNSSVNVVLSGKFQSWKYFDQDSSLVRTELKFRRFLLQEAHDVIANHIGKSFRKTPLVGFHIVTRKLRHLPPSEKFDSLDPMASRTFASEYVVFPPLSYVMRAMDHLRMKFGKALFLVFCEDLTWCKKRMQFADVVIIRGQPSPVQLAILAQTQASILTTSSLGWWGAWLSKGYTVYSSNYPWAQLHRGAGNSTPRDYFLPTWKAV